MGREQSLKRVVRLMKIEDRVYVIGGGERLRGSEYVYTVTGAYPY